MAKLTYKEISEYAKLAGFSERDANIATAIALAESGGDPRAHNAVPPDDSYGLWQINMIGALGPARRRKYHLSSNERLYDPQTNAYVAYGIFKDSGWKAWTTYTRGTYKKFLPGGQGGPIDNLGEEAKGIEERVKDTFPDLTGGFNALGQNIFNGVAGLTGVIVASVMLVLGIVILMRNVIPVGKTIKFAKKVVT